MPERGEMPSTKDQLEVTNADRIAFHLAEFAAVKAEIGELVRQTGVYLTFATSTCCGIAAWLFTHPMQQQFIHWASWLPLTVSGLLGTLAASCYLRISQKNRYLRRLEASLGSPDLGFSKQFLSEPWVIGTAHTSLWGALNFGGLLVGWVQPFPLAPAIPIS